MHQQCILSLKNQKKNRFPGGAGKKEKDQEINLLLHGNFYILGIICGWGAGQGQPAAPIHKKDHKKLKRINKEIKRIKTKK